MFSLIITIISIALVAALAVATIYYGGSAFTQGTAKANASALVSAGQQVSGALTLYANDKGGARATLANLTDTSTAVNPGGAYLSAAPSVKGGALTIAASSVQVASVEKAVCDAINTSAGVTAPTTEALALSSTAPYSCWKALPADATGTFVFKG
jgi:type II secretory pathway pseudopilin PulG